MIKAALALILLTGTAYADVVIENHAKQKYSVERINKIYQDVLEFTGFKDQKIKLVVYDNEADLCTTYRHFGYKTPCPRGFTLPGSRIIWVSSVAYWLLVHEFTHALGPDLPKGLREVLPNYVVKSM